MRFILVCRVCHVSMSLQNFPQQANLHLCWNIFNVGQKRQKMWDQLTYDYPNRVLWDKTEKNWEATGKVRNHLAKHRI